MLWQLCVLLEVALAADSADCPSKAANLLQQKTSISDVQQIMWLTGVSLSSTCKNEMYLNEYEVALLSWKDTKNSAFDPHLLVHLPSGTVPESVGKRLKRFEEIGANVVFHNLSFIGELKRNLHNLRPADDLDAECVAGAFLRLEIPRIVSEKQLLQPHHHQEHVLWTDSDILWWRNVPLREFLADIPTAKFSLAFSGQTMKQKSPENTGVMLMNLKNYQQDMPQLLASIATAPRNSGLDQSLIHEFYQDHPGLSGWSVIWNYRMFWNGHDDVAILHYWGLKPSEGLDCWMQRRTLMGCPDIQQGLIPNDRRDLQMQALQEAISEDRQLVFMGAANRRFKKFQALIGK